MTSQVKAAGGIVWRRVPAGVEVVVVHRPAYDDWSFPKGKVEQGESDEEGALREVLEETGLACRLGPELSSTTYRDERGRPKLVRYWSMTLVPGAPSWGGGPLGLPEPAHVEVDAVRWEVLGQVRRILTYARDVMVLDSFEERALRSDVRRQQVDNVLKSKPQRDKAN